MVSTSRINGISGNLSVKIPVRVATTSAITLASEQVIDGISVVDGDRVLVKDQVDTTTNGVYVCSTGTWARSKDFNGNNDIVDGTFFLCKQGTQNANSYWRVVSVDNPVVLGTSLLTFTQIFLGLSATLSSLSESDFMLYDSNTLQFVNKTVEQVKTALGISDDDEGQTTWKVKRFVAGTNYTAGTTTQLSLDSAPGSENNCFIYFQGVYQEKAEFGLSGTTITFISAIPVGVTSVEVVHGSAVSVGVPEDASVDTIKLADLSITFGKIASATMASQAEAWAGTVSNKLMTPLTTKQAIDELGPKILLETVTASADADVTFSSNIDTTYNRYLVEIDGLLPATDASYLRMRTSTNGGVAYDSGASDYKSIRDGRRGSGAVDTEGGGDTDSMDLTVSETVLSNVAAEAAFYEVEIMNPGDANTHTHMKFNGRGINGSGNIFHIKGGGVRNAAALVDAIQFYMSAGNITSGTFRLYGLR